MSNEEILELDKDTDFFLDGFQSCEQELSSKNLSGVKDVRLQCLGYGLFDQQQALQTFKRVLALIVTKCQKIGTLRITLNGFKISKDQDLFKQLTQSIRKTKGSIKTLHIFTTNLKSVILQNFMQLLRLSLDLNNSNFQNFTLQCANWIFQGGNQPKFGDLKKQMEQFAKNANKQVLKNKIFRLQMSGWYYQKLQALAFLDFYDDEKKKGQSTKIYQQDSFVTQTYMFRETFKEIIRKIVRPMPELQLFQFDMRNTHQILKLKDMKSQLDKQKITEGGDSSILSQIHNNAMNNTFLGKKTRTITLNINV